jgi:hypothetical protein
VICSFIGYFVDDLLRLGRTNEFDFIAHHLLGIILLSFGLTLRVDDRIYAPFGLLEISTLFLNTSQLAERISIARWRRRVRRVAAVAFLVTFCALRVIFLPLHLRSAALVEQRARLGKLFHLTYAAWALQLFWLKEIVERVQRIE